MTEPVWPFIGQAQYRHLTIAHKQRQGVDLIDILGGNSHE
jgi:hypothetical protein